MPHNLLLNLTQTDLDGSVEASSRFFNASSKALARWASLKTDEFDSVVIDDVSPRFSEMILSTATTGYLFPISPPVSDGNSTYFVDFIAPKVLCDESSPTVARDTIIAAVHALAYIDTNTDSFTFDMSGINFENLTYSYEEPSPSLSISRNRRDTRLEQIGYYALIPFEDSSVDEAIGFEDSGYAEGKRNELRIVIGYRAPDTEKTVSTFLTCQLWNASWTMNVSTAYNIQTVKVTRITLLNKVDVAFNSWSLPSNYNGPPLQLNLNKALYTVFFRGVAKHLLGYMGRTDSRGIKNTVRSSDIRGTVLAGSTEYAKMLRSITPIDNTSAAESHKPLRTMIEEFSENVTFNLMTDEFFRLVQPLFPAVHNPNVSPNSTRVQRPVSRVRYTNVYIYEPSNLLLAYGIAAFAALITTWIGVRAIRSNGVNYGLNASTVICTTQNPDVSARPSPGGENVCAELRLCFLDKRRGRKPHDGIAALGGRYCEDETPVRQRADEGRACACGVWRAGDGQRFAKAIGRLLLCLSAYSSSLQLAIDTSLSLA